MKDAPVYLIASERSGTNLLRKLFTEHQNVYFGPPPAHFFTNLYPMTPYYGSLDDDDNMRLFLHDAVDLCKVHFSPWDIKMDAERVLVGYDLRHEHRNAILLFDYMMHLIAEEKDYSSYFCKDNRVFDFVFEILYRIPKAKFIYLHRDPRDFALSQLKRTLQTDSLVKISQIWKTEQMKCISVLDELGSDRVYRISYEELVTEPDEWMQDLCRFLNVEYTVTKKVNGIATGTSKEWQNLDKPVMKNNTKKYLEELSSRQISMIENICRVPMEFLGYKLEGPIRRVSSFEKYVDIVLGTFRGKWRSRYRMDTEDLWSIERRKLLRRIRERR